MTSVDEGKGMERLDQLPLRTFAPTQGTIPTISCFFFFTLASIIFFPALPLSDTYPLPRVLHLQLV